MIGVDGRPLLQELATIGIHQIMVVTRKGHDLRLVVGGPIHRPEEVGQSVMSTGQVNSTREGFLRILERRSQGLLCLHLVTTGAEVVFLLLSEIPETTVSILRGVCKGSRVSGEKRARRHSAERSPHRYNARFTCLSTSI